MSAGALFSACAWSAAANVCRALLISCTGAPAQAVSAAMKLATAMRRKAQAAMYSAVSRDAP